MQPTHRAPSPDLREIVARHYVFGAELPSGYELQDDLLSETAFIRILIQGDWAARMPDGSWSNVGPMVFFGANARPLRVRVCGSFKVIGVAIRPAGWHTLFDRPANLYTDCMISLRDVWGEDSDRLHQAVLGAGEDVDAVITAIEEVLRTRISARPAAHPDQAMLAFERIARFDSTRRIADICKELGIAQHALERRCMAMFGMSPKRILRRSRFLDMAAVIRGLCNPDEQVLAELRYTDQSHLNREFREFIGMTPGQFAHSTTPLLTAGLELRFGRRESDPSSEFWA